MEKPMSDDEIIRLWDSVTDDMPNAARWREMCRHLLHEERDHLNTIMERDALEHALSAAHVALGGDGEWVGRNPMPAPPDSGDLARDVPELADALARERAELKAVVEKLETWPGTTLGEPVEAGSERDTPENRAFQRGLNMAFFRCAEVCKAALAASGSPAGSPPRQEKP
jgi:hypothetical protein